MYIKFFRALPISSHWSRSIESDFMFMYKIDVFIYDLYIIYGGVGWLDVYIVDKLSLRGIEQ